MKPHPQDWQAILDYFADGRIFDLYDASLTHIPINPQMMKAMTDAGLLVAKTDPRGYTRYTVAKKGDASK